MSQTDWKRRAPIVAAACLSGVFGVLGLLRLSTFHNQTFDLAFYSRLAWGAAELDAWQPFLNCHVFGLHLSPILLPVGWLGRIVGTAPALLGAQALAAALAGWAVARVGERHLGTAGAWLGVGALLLHPNLGHVLSYEAHPGTLAIAPLAWSLERFDAGDRRRALLAGLLVLLCREDLALLNIMLAALMIARGWRSHGLALGLVSFLWLAFFVVVLHPAYAPEGGSFQLHFGQWGDTPGEALTHWLSHPGSLIDHMFSGRRATYLVRVLAPLAFLPLLAPRLLLIAAPILFINLASGFSTTPNLDSHYLTPAMPAFATAAVLGGARLSSWLKSRRGASNPTSSRVIAGLVALSLTAGYAMWGVRDPVPFSSDLRSLAASRTLALVPETASVQAPDVLLPHLATRRRVHRGPTATLPDWGDEITVLDIGHRDRFAHSPSLLRTHEEPVVRQWLSRQDYGLIGAYPPFLVFRRGADPRHSRYIEGQTDPDEGVRLSACLGWTGAEILPPSPPGQVLIELSFVATAPCPADLALRFSDGRVDLLFDGLLSPAHLRRGDAVRSTHVVPSAELRDLSLGLIRTSGAPPAHGDPRTVAYEDAFGSTSAE